MPPETTSAKPAPFDEKAFTSALDAQEQYLKQFAGIPGHNPVTGRLPHVDGYNREDSLKAIAGLRDRFANGERSPELAATVKLFKQEPPLVLPSNVGQPAIGAAPPKAGAGNDMPAGANVGIGTVAESN